MMEIRARNDNHLAEPRLGLKLWGAWHRMA
jgi:hypothetical protein